MTCLHVFALQSQSAQCSIQFRHLLHKQLSIESRYSRYNAPRRFRCRYIDNETDMSHYNGYSGWHSPPPQKKNLSGFTIISGPSLGKVGGGSCPYLPPWRRHWPALQQTSKKQSKECTEMTATSATETLKSSPTVCRLLHCIHKEQHVQHVCVYVLKLLDKGGYGKELFSVSANSCLAAIAPLPSGAVFNTNGKKTNTHTY